MAMVINTEDIQAAVYIPSEAIPEYEFNLTCTPERWEEFKKILAKGMNVQTDLPDWGREFYDNLFGITPLIHNPRDTLKQP